MKNESRKSYLGKKEQKQCFQLFLDRPHILLLRVRFWMFNRGRNRLVFSRLFDICGNLGNAKEKPTRKTCFSREMKRLDLP